jgi:hypothetical protein
VFFNACEVGATGSVFGEVGGWADAFLERRFGGFIAPLWAVEEEDSAQVAAELLDQHLCASRTNRRSAACDSQQVRGQVADVLLVYLLR